MTCELSNLRGCSGWCNTYLIIGNKCTVFIAACSCMMQNTIVFVTLCAAHAIDRNKCDSGIITVFKHSFEICKWRECSCDGVLRLVNAISRIVNELLTDNNGRVYSAWKGGADLLHLRLILFIVSYHSNHISIIRFVALLVSGYLYFLSTYVFNCQWYDLLSCVYFQLSSPKCAAAWEHTNCSHFTTARRWYICSVKAWLQQT